jgi:hypothetical protein
MEHSEETKHKIASSLQGKMRGKSVSTETRHKLSVALRGNHNTLGKRHSLATRQKIALAMKGNTNRQRAPKNAPDDGEERKGMLSFTRDSSVYNSQPEPCQN